MQTVKFATVDEFLDYLPHKERVMVEYLRGIVLDCLPSCKEKLSYNVPFYSRYGRICFIWPPSVLWGSKGPKGVQLGFCKGHLMADELNYLEKDGRKEVYIKTYTTVAEIKEEVVRAYLMEAVEIDEQVFAANKSGINKANKKRVK